MKRCGTGLTKLATIAQSPGPLREAALAKVTKADQRQVSEQVLEQLVVLQAAVAIACPTTS